MRAYGPFRRKNHGLLVHPALFHHFPHATVVFPPVFLVETGCLDAAGVGVTRIKWAFQKLTANRTKERINSRERLRERLRAEDISIYCCGDILMTILQGVTNALILNETPFTRKKPDAFLETPSKLLQTFQPYSYLEACPL